MTPVFVHRFALSEHVFSENLDLLVSCSQSYFPNSETLLHLPQLRALGLDAFGLSVDPVLFGLDVLRRVLRAVESLLVPFEFSFHNSLAS